MSDYELLQLRAYRDLINFVHWIAHIHAQEGHWLFNFQDLEAELLLAVARCMHKYLDTKPYDEFLVISRAAIRNSLGALKYKAFLTHRRMEATNLDLDAPVGDEEETLGDVLPADTGDPEQYVMSAELVAEVAGKLDELQLRVLDALLGGNDRVMMYLILYRRRLNWVWANPTITITPEIVADALCESVESVRAAYEAIQVTLGQVSYGKEWEV